MKFIHTSDWHIGKSIYEMSLLEDQKCILNSFLKLIDEEKPDAIIIAGDLYDRAVPSKEAVNILDNILNEIVMIKKVPVLCIAGNHDSGERLEFASRILNKNGLLIEGKIKSQIQSFEFNDEYGKIFFHLIPFAYVNEIQELYKEHEIKNYDDAYKIMLNELHKRIDKNYRHIIITHGFVVSNTEELEIDDSVRPLSVGTTEYVNVDYFKDFDYTALGHLHKPQKVKYNYVRYSGSLLKYSFSEVNHKKGVTIVEIKEKGNILIKNAVLQPIKNMKCIEGKLGDLINIKREDDITSDYIMAVLTDENPIYDAISSLRAIYPNILRMEYKFRSTYSIQNNALTIDKKGKKSEVDMFKEFYEDMTGRELEEKKIKIIEEFFEEIISKGGEVN